MLLQPILDMIVQVKWCNRTDRIEIVLSQAALCAAGTIGTAAYCAPELLDATSPVSAQTAQQVLKSDVYSFGVLLWQILTRRRPYEGMDGFQVRCAHTCRNMITRLAVNSTETVQGTVWVALHCQDSERVQ